MFSYVLQNASEVLQRLVVLGCTRSTIFSGRACRAQWFNFYLITEVGGMWETRTLAEDFKAS